MVDDSPLLDDNLLDDNLIEDQPSLLEALNQGDSVGAHYLLSPLGSKSPVKEEATRLPAVRTFQFGKTKPGKEVTADMKLNSNDEDEEEIEGSDSANEFVPLIEEEIGDLIQGSGNPSQWAGNKAATVQGEVEEEKKVQPEEEVTLMEVNWSIFEKISKLGEGANGVVYKVKALKDSIFSTEHNGRIELSDPDLIKKLAGSSKQKLGVNMQSQVENSNKTRHLQKD